MLACRQSIVGRANLLHCAAVLQRIETTVQPPRNYLV